MSHPDWWWWSWIIMITMLISINDTMTHHRWNTYRVDNWSNIRKDRTHVETEHGGPRKPLNITNLQCWIQLGKSSNKLFGNIVQKRLRRNLKSPRTKKIFFRFTVFKKRFEQNCASPFDCWVGEDNAVMGVDTGNA